MQLALRFSMQLPVPALAVPPDEPVDMLAGCGGLVRDVAAALWLLLACPFGGPLPCYLLPAEPSRPGPSFQCLTMPWYFRLAVVILVGFLMLGPGGLPLPLPLSWRRQGGWYATSELPGVLSAAFLASFCFLRDFVHGR